MAQQKKLQTKKKVVRKSKVPDISKIKDDLHFSEIVMSKFTIKADTSFDFEENALDAVANIEFKIGKYISKQGDWPCYLNFSINAGEKENKELWNSEAEYTLFICCHSDELMSLIEKRDGEVIEFIEAYSAHEVWPQYRFLLKSMFWNCSLPQLTIPSTPPPKQKATFTMKKKRSRIRSI